MWLFLLLLLRKKGGRQRDDERHTCELKFLFEAMLLQGEMNRAFLIKNAGQVWFFLFCTILASTAVLQLEVASFAWNEILNLVF